MLNFYDGPAINCSKLVADLVRIGKIRLFNLLRPHYASMDTKSLHDPSR